jgi:tetratricopeptide (TPR) repeat protein
VADAAVLGTTFTAEALIAVSGQGEPVMRATLAELVRREVLTVSADPLSPEKGSYQFAQNMLRQVAYDTLSRRDRKARHLKVAAHLRAAFPGDGEEVTDVIARHYLDALDALPTDSDAGEIRDQAIAALRRAAERADRTGAPALAATSYATAARLTQAGAYDGDATAAALWEHAAGAALTDGDWAAAIEQAGQAGDLYRQDGDSPSAARAQTIAGEALRVWGRHGDAREQLTAALGVLREDPDTDTVQALGQLAMLETFAGTPAADPLTAEALALGQDLVADDATLADLFTTRGVYLGLAGHRLPQAGAYLREAVRLAEQAGDSRRLGRALLNLAHMLSATDPAAAAEAARAAVGHLRRAGARNPLSVAAMNLVQALLMTGDWDTAEDELAQAIDADDLGDLEYIRCYRAWMAALRGDAATAQAVLAALGDLRVSEDVQDKEIILVVEAFTAAADHQPAAALRHARTALDQADVVGISHEYLRWAWPLAARTAYDLADAATVEELLTMLDGYRPGQLTPMLRAERDLTRARRTAADVGPDAASAAFVAAIAGLRQHSTPYHLAHGLLDHAEYLLRAGDDEAAGAATGEARSIAERLRCQPLIDRAEAIQPASPRTAASG